MASYIITVKRSTGVASFDAAYEDSLGTRHPSTGTTNYTGTNIGFNYVDHVWIKSINEAEGYQNPTATLSGDVYESPSGSGTYYGNGTITLTASVIPTTTYYAKLTFTSGTTDPVSGLPSDVSGSTTSSDRYVRLYIPQQEPTRSGYTFDYWTYSGNSKHYKYGGGTGLYAYDDWIGQLNVSSATYTLVAHWTQVTSGVTIWIDNGSSWDQYYAYIDNGTSWDLYTPQIDNGSTWD